MPLARWKSNAWPGVQGINAIIDYVNQLAIGRVGSLLAAPVTNSSLQDMAQATIKGRAAAAGTGTPTDLTANQVSTVLDSATDPFLRTSEAVGGGAISLDDLSDVMVASPAPSDGDVLTYSAGSPGGWVAAAPAGGSGLVLLESHAAAASSSLNFTSWYSSSYDSYLIQLVNLIPSADGELRYRVSTDGGSTWQSGGSTYDLLVYYWNMTTGGIFVSGGPNDHIKLGTQESTGITGQSGTINMFAPGSSSAKLFSHDVVVLNTSSQYETIKGGGVWKSGTAINGIQFYYNGTTIASGTIRVYGYAT